jgi:DNA-binding HxlR family transcriptional regulator
MERAHRSGCPINLTVEMLGDRWSLVVIRDIMFGDRRHFRELLNRSEEGIASNILADRLKRLVAAGLLSKRDHPSHKQKSIYSLTEAAIELVPLLAHMGAWGRRHTPVSEELSIRARLLEEGGPPMWDAFMAELRSLHTGAQPPGRSVRAELQAAFEAVVARNAGLQPPASA